jgi:signal transduction histidine kinase
MNETSGDHDDELIRIAHELSQPLTALVAAARLAQSDNPATANRARGAIERQATYMQALVNGLLEGARIHGSRAAAGMARIDMRDIVARVLDANEAVFAEQRLQVTSSIPEEPAWVHGDDMRLQEILWNLLTNAIRHTPPGGTIAVGVTMHDDHVVVTVRDTGGGLRPGEMRRIFGAFVQGERGTTEGLGLGLAVARELAQRHGGTIDVSSGGRGQGSEFSLILPAPGTAG